MSSAGRPTSYQPHFAEQAEKLCRMGATDADMADFFEVSIRTVQRWQSQHEEFCRAVKTGKDAADDRVERSLYQRAVGYDFEAVKIFQHKGDPVVIPYREHVPPDTTAQIFWLKNRRKEMWRDKTETETTIGFTQEFEEFVRGLNDKRKTKVIDAKPVAGNGCDVGKVPARIRN